MLDKELRSMIGDVKDGRMDRRAFIQRLAAVGLTAPMANQILAIGDVALQAGRILRPAMGCRDSRKRGARRRARRPGPGIWWCQAVRSAKARVTAAVRLETCSSR